MSALQGLSQQSGSTCLYDHQHPGGGVEGPMESLAEIMTRVERLAFAQEQEQSVSPPVLQLPSSAEQATLPLDLPPVEVSTSLEYIQAEAFLEVSRIFRKRVFKLLLLNQSLRRKFVGSRLPTS